MITVHIDEFLQQFTTQLAKSIIFKIILIVLIQKNGGITDFRTRRMYLESSTFFNKEIDLETEPGSQPKLTPISERRDEILTEGN